jgi:hypothetical protein
MESPEPASTTWHDLLIKGVSPLVAATVMGVSEAVAIRELRKAANRPARLGPRPLRSNFGYRRRAGG